MRHFGQSDQRGRWAAPRRLPPREPHGSCDDQQQLAPDKVDIRSYLVEYVEKISEAVTFLSTSRAAEVRI